MSALSPVRKLVGAVLAGRRASRPRALWRVLIPLLAVFVPGSIGTAFLYGSFGEEFFALASSALFAGLTVVALVVSSRWLDRRPVAAYGFDFGRTWAVEFAVGTILGVALYASVLAAALGLGWATIAEWASAGETLGFATGFALLLLAYLLVGFWEEALFRGIVLTNVDEGLAERGLSGRFALVGAILISSALFAVLHLNQAPSVGALPFLLGTWLLMGGLFALAFVATDSLALPIGLHFAVNLSTNGLFGFTGEWGTGSPSLVRLAITAPEYAVAIDGVLDGSALHAAAILVAYACVVAWISRR